VADLNGLLIFTSHKAMQMFRDSPDDEILGRSISSWVAPEEQEKASSNMPRLLTEGTLTATEYTTIKKDGTRFIGEVNAAVIHSPDGSPMRMIFITRDVTERKRAEEALRESEQRLSQIIDFLPDATFAIDLNGKVIAWNRAGIVHRLRHR
jgi:PAS domain S-box-containing protein